jgi:hypothetical protein
MKENGQTNLRETEAKEILFYFFIFFKKKRRKEKKKIKKRMMKDELELLVSLP